MDALAIAAVGAVTRRLVAVALLFVLAGCGGGGGSSESPPPDPPPPPPTVGTLTNPPNSGLAEVGLGDPQFVLYAFPGEKIERVLGLALTQPAEFDVSVTEGADMLAVIQAAGRYSLVVDSTALASGVSRSYRVAIRNRSTGVTAEIFGPVRVMAPTTIASGQITELGGVVPASDASLRLEVDAKPGAPSLVVTVLAIDQPSGGRQFRIKFDRDISADARGMRIVQAPVPTPSASTQTARVLSSSANPRSAAAAEPDPGFVDWIRVRRHFTLSGGYRLRDGPISLQDWVIACGPHIATLFNICLQEFDAWALTGQVPRSAIPSNPAVRIEPVLFVHGYTKHSALGLGSPTLGGGIETWGNLPKLVTDASVTVSEPRFIAFEFQWATNARFGDVADDLAAAVTAIYQATGGKVTVVAHSMGGILARTLLQGLGTRRINVADKVRQLVTLGTPHSGIAFAEGKFFGVTLPDGQDSLWLNLCAQITCHEMGVPILSLNLLGPTGLLGVDLKPGHLVARLADTRMPAAVPVAVGIGLSRSLSSLPDFGNGDGLISLAGQRYEPTATLSPTAAALLNCQGMAIEEVMLGGPLRRPGLQIGTNERGYAHNSFVAGFDDDVEANVTSAEHPSYKLVERALRFGICPGAAPAISTGPQDVSVPAGQPATFSVTAGGLSLRYTWFKNSDPDAIPNATSATYTIPSVTAADNGARFSVVVSNLVGSTTSASAQLTVTTAGPAPSQGQRIATGSNGHTCAVTPAGGVKCWGSNFAGQLGDGTRQRRLTAVDVIGLSAGVTSVSVGADFSCALTSAGGVKCWGQGGRTGDGSTGGNVEPVDVVGLSSGVSAISAGESEICALTTAGGVKCWGHSLLPVEVAGLSSGVVAVAAGWKATCVITVAGGVKCWGGWPLGDGAGQGSDIPVDVIGLSSGVAAISSSAGGICAVTTAGAALCWATIFPGDGSNALAFLPVVPSGLGTGVSAISTAGDLTCVLMTSGAVKCWGKNGRGGVGVGAFNGRWHSPADVVGLSSGVIAIGTAHDTACALMSSGGAKCWGYNVDGAVGDGTQLDRHTPTDVVDF